MLGFSYYLTDPLDERMQQYFEDMSKSGFEEVFTSLHIPEEDPQQKKSAVQKLMRAAEYNGLSVVIDVDKASLSYLPKNISSKLTLRLDDGFTANDIASISQEVPIALNASTITNDFFTQLNSLQIDFSTIEAWHNFYPRPETGLDTQWFLKKNHWLKSLGFKVAAFIPGDENLRGPIFEGLPTLELQRHQNILSSAITLNDYGVDKIVVADPGLSHHLRHKFKNYFIKHILELDAKQFIKRSPLDFSKVYTTRADPSLLVVRIKEARPLVKEPLHPDHIVSRVKGSITFDNKKYGRYNGELQITKSDLPVDEKVNVFGQVSKLDESLLPLIKPDQKIKFNFKED